jgi:hypothetical protein
MPRSDDPCTASDHLSLAAFLSWLRLAIYMAVVSVAILISFHLKREPSPLERRIALPFGLIFWLLALACLASGTANYIKNVKGYSRQQALVQTGWKTQVVSFAFDSTLSVVLTNPSGLYHCIHVDSGSLCTLSIHRSGCK